MYGVCRICGCTENIACQHPDHGACWWIDNTHTLCSHCGIDEIKNDAATTHPKKKAYRELPIPYSEVMVKSILLNLKKMTRRTTGLETINQHPDKWRFDGHAFDSDDEDPTQDMYFEKLDNDGNPTEYYVQIYPKYKIGDQLWVKETYQHTKILNINPEDENYGFVYKADGQPWSDYEGWRWITGRFMPKIATRMWLEVTDVKCERLQSICTEDCINEGILPLSMSAAQLAEQGQKYFDYSTPKQLFTDGLDPFWSFNSLWCSINGGDSWDLNPWVFVYTFKKIEKQC